jgi:hypothetical protein
MGFFVRNYGVSTYDELLTNTIHGRQPGPLISGWFGPLIESKHFVLITKFWPILKIRIPEAS